MRNPYAEVAMSYLRNAVQGSLVAAICSAAGLLLLIPQVFLDSPAGSDEFSLLAVALLGSSLVIHLKEELASSRPRLWPEYVRVQVTVALWFAGGIVGIVTMLVWRAAPSINLWFPATSTAVLASLIWLSSVLRPSQTPWALACVCFALQYAAGPFRPQMVNETLFRGEHQLLAIPALAISGLAMFAGLLWTASMTEDSVIYRRAVRSSKPDFDDAHAAETLKEPPFSLWRWFGRTSPISDRRLRRLRKSRPTTLWAQAQRWRLARSSTSPWEIGLLISIIVVIPSLLSPTPLVPAEGGDGADSVAPFLVFLSLIMLAPPWQDRRQRLGLESLRPADRATFFRTIGLAMGIDLLCALISIWLAILGLSAFFRPELLHSGLLWIGLSLSPCVGMYVLSGSAWLMRHRRPLPIIIGGLVWIAILTLPVTALVVPDLVAYRHAAILVLILLGPLSLAILYDAYRRWLVTDLD